MLTSTEKTRHVACLSSTGRYAAVRPQRVWPYHLAKLAIAECTIIWSYKEIWAHEPDRTASDRSTFQQAT